MAESSVDEVADGIYRISSRLPGAVDGRDLTINVFLLMADEPLLFHTGLRACLRATAAALGRLLPLSRLRWLSFGHVEADECGAMNGLLAAAPHAEVAFNARGCWMSLRDMADRPPRALAPREALDLGGRRVVVVPTPHVPHNVESQVLYEETTGTLLCGDLFAQLGDGPAVTRSAPVAEALAAESALAWSPPGEAVPRALESLAGLEPRTLAIMHGSSFEGDGGRALRELAAAWRDRLPLPTGEREAAGQLAG
ncbi:MAG TPA: MBL fold metallo-hydrolase [Acidimicrobiales bacterium]|nr:MBL fold metallo-hydrolase [Acidimicrobiales bacterium]